jgi:hypothetical protein
VLEKAGLVKRGEIEQAFVACGGLCRVPLFRAERRAAAAASK